MKILPCKGRGTARRVVEGAIGWAQRPAVSPLRQSLRDCYLPVPGRIFLRPLALTPIRL